MNSLEAELIYANDLADSEKLDQLYRRTFRGVNHIECITDRNIQRLGIDKKIIFNDGSVVKIEEKKRRTDYGDCFIETWSVFENGKRGWVYTTQADFIAYYVVPLNIVFFIPVLPLRKSWKIYGEEWMKKYGEKSAPNTRYTTKGVAVPWEILMEKVNIFKRLLEANVI